MCADSSFSEDEVSDSDPAPSSTEPRILALRRLGRREYSSAEMISYLERRGIGRETAVSVVTELVEEHLIDDSRFARMLARYQAIRGKGSVYILSKLRQKGIQIELSEVRKLLEENGETNELETARQFVRRRYPLLAQDRKIAARAYQALLRRGFSHQTARDALKDPDPSDSPEEL